MSEADNTLMIFCDGLCEPNPGGWGCWAWIARSPKGTRLREAYGNIGRGSAVTGNLAEYTAVLNALSYTVGRLSILVERRLGVVIYSDSQLVINQIRGEWACNKSHLRDIRDRAVQIAETLRAAGVSVDFVWIPREQNEDADALTRKAYQEARRGSHREAKA